jgi:hypothetical protein
MVKQPMRSTKIVTTPSGKKVELKTYITGREQREIDAVALEGVNLSFDDDGKMKVGKLDPQMGHRAENKQLESVVVSVDGEPSDLEKVLDLPSTDFQFILKEVSEIIKGLDKKK